MMIDGVGRGAGPRPAGVPEAGVKAPARDVVAAPVAAQAPAASTLGRIVGDLAAAPPVDTAKVERLRAAIAGGTYVVDPDKIAERMLALESVPKAK